MVIFNVALGDYEEVTHADSVDISCLLRRAAITYTLHSPILLLRVGISLV